MKKTAFYFRGLVKETVSAPIFKMLEALLELFVPLMVKKIIDTGIGRGDKAYICEMCALLLSLSFAGLALSVTAQFFAAKAAAGFSSRLRNALFEHIGNFSYSELDEAGASSLIARMTSDVNQVQNGVNLTLRLLLRSPFVVFGAVIMAFTVDKACAWVFVCAVPALAAAVSAIMLFSVPLFKKVQKKTEAVLSAVRNTLNGVRVLRAFGTEKRDIEDFREKNSDLTSAGIRAGNISALLNPLTYVMINIAAAVLIYTGAVRVSTGSLTQGAVVALYNYMAQILVELIKLARLIITITKALASRSRIKTVFAVKPSVSYPDTGEEPDFNAPAVEFENVSLTYKNAGAPALKNLSFRINRGEKIGIIGSTGSGKSSTVNLTARFYDCSSGRVRLFGNDIKSYSREKLNSLVSVAEQKTALFSGSIRENLLWGKKNASQAEIDKALNTAQAKNITDAKDRGLDSEVGESGKNFSGGQKQRLSIARALLKNAPILILDDCTSALDAATDLSFRRALSLDGGVSTVITVSQRISGVSGCDRIFVIEDGRLAGAGTHRELLASNEIYREIYASQKGEKADE